MLIWLQYAKLNGAGRTRGWEIKENPCQVQVGNDGSGMGKVEVEAGNTGKEAQELSSVLISIYCWSFSKILSNPWVP